jgi:hypothetical protein
MPGRLKVKRRRWPAVACLLLMINTNPAQVQNAPPAQKAPAVAGTWTGTWSAYNPARGAGSEKELCKRLDCTITEKGGVYEATFEGDCGRAYKYSIKMEGRQVGQVVLFKGTTDLGAKDGGVFDWIGRATDKEFVGFFTSGYYTGVFNLARPK